MKISQLKPEEYVPYFQIYFDQVSDEYSMIEELEISVHRLVKFVQDIPMDKFDYRYAADKWTIKDILQHLIDSERIFAYRALRIARNDKTELPGFDDNHYANETSANKRSIMSLLTELMALRQSTILLFKTFSEAQLEFKGIVSGNPISVRALGFLIIGHQNHHQSVFDKYYLN